MFGEYGEIVQRTVLALSKGERAQTVISILDGKPLENAVLPLNVKVANLN